MKPPKPPQNPPSPNGPPQPPPGKNDGKGTNYAGYSTYGDYGTYGYGSGYGTGYGGGYGGYGYGGQQGYGGYSPGGYSGYYYGYGYGGNQQGGEPTQSRNIRDYLVILRERIWYLLLTFFVIFGAFILYLINATPMFLATASLKVNKTEVTAMQTVHDTTTDVLGPEDLNTRIRMMETREIAEKVAGRMTPDEQKDFLLPFQSTSKLAVNEGIVERLMQHRQVAPGRLAWFIQVGVEHPNAQLAAKVADYFSQVFIEDNDQRNAERAQKAVEVLTNDYTAQKKKVEDLQLQMSNMVNKYGMTNLDPKSNVLPNQLQELVSIRTGDQSALDNAEVQWNQVQEYQTAIPPKDLWNLPSIAKDSHVSDLKRDLDASLVQLAGDQKSLGEKHPKIIADLQKRDQAQQELTAACVTAAQRVFQDYKAAQEKFQRDDQQVKDLQSLMHDMNNVQVKYDELVSEKDTAQEMSKLQQNTIEAQKARVLEGGESYQIADSAAGQVTQTAPKTTLTIVGGLITGIMGGVGMAFLVAFLDDRIKSAFDIESFVGLPLIGILPRIAHLNANEKAQAVASNADRRITEAFRSIYSALKLNDASKNARVILVTSTVPSEGKSFMTTNLALTYAMHGERVLLIDCDLRMPNIAKSLGKDINDNGLMTHLRDGRAFEECVVKDFYPGLDVLPTGGRTNNPTQIFNGREFADFIARMRQQYDRVFIDSPPLGAVSDALNLLPNVDGVLYVIKFNAVKRKVAKVNLSRLMQGNVPVFGAILNQISLTSASYYYTHYYDKSYRNYYMHADDDKTEAAAAAAAAPGAAEAPPAAGPDNKS